jgi:hypothetical protein
MSGRLPYLSLDKTKQSKKSCLLRCGPQLSLLQCVQRATAPLPRGATRHSL